MENAMLGVNIILLMLVWRFMVKKTILDHTRDKLFDLRDEVRATFVANNWDLSSPVYRRLRDLLNGHLRFTEDYSIWKLAYLNAAIDKQKNLQAELHEQFEKNFNTSIPGQLDFVKSIRARSMMSIMEFSVYGSGFLLFLTVLITPFFVVAKTLNVLNRGAEAAATVCVRSLHNFGKVSASMLAAAAGVFSKHLLTPDWFEPYSYKIGTSH